MDELKKLLNELKDPKMYVRLSAAYRLRDSFYPASPEIIPALAEALQHNGEHWSIKTPIIEALYRRLHNVESRECLADFVIQNYQTHIFETESTLLRIFLGIALPALNVLQDVYSSVIQDASHATDFGFIVSCRALSDLGLKEIVFERLAQFAGADDPSITDLRQIYLNICLAHNPHQIIQDTDTFFTSLIHKFIQSTDPVQQRMYRRAALRLGWKLQDSLIDENGLLPLIHKIEVTTNTFELEQYSAFLFDVLGSHASIVLNTLLERFHDAEPKIRRCILICLANSGDSSALALLRQLCANAYLSEDYSIDYDDLEIWWGYNYQRQLRLKSL